MTLTVNTIEFNGVKAVINSYSHHPALVNSQQKQLAEWQASYPKAIVESEELTEAETIALVAAGGKEYGFAYRIGESSK